MNHRTGRLVFGFSVGLLVAMFSYRWIVDPAPKAERALEESVVIESRAVLASVIGVSDLEIVDALAKNRKVGKAYIYRNGDGWEVSGFYRRSEEERWHAFLLSLGAAVELEHAKLQDDDAELAARAANDARLEAVP